MLKSMDPKALVTHPAAAAVILIAAHFILGYRFFLADDFLPLHDTGAVFQVFKTAYSNYLQTGDLSEWLPQGVYGYQTHLETVFRISPISYPVMALGKLFGALDTLALFRTVVLLEITVFAFGFLRLADEVFENRTVSVFALASFLMTTVVINQIYWSLRIVYLLPLVTYYILSFFKTGRGIRLIMAAVFTFISVFGAPVYFSIYYAIYFITLFFLFYYVYRKQFRLVIDRPLIIAAPAAALLMGVGAYVILTSTDGLAFIAPGRDPVTLKVDLDTFLDYGGGGIEKSFELLFANTRTTRDVNFYIPAAALIFAIYALARVRDRVFLAFAAAFAFFLVLAWGRFSPLAYVIYYLPGVSYLRHIGLLYAVPKMLLCLIAGFGVQHFLAATAGGGDAYHKERRFLAVTAGLGAFVVVTTLLLAVFVVGTAEADSPRTGMVAMSALGFLAVAAVAVPSTLGRRTLLGTSALVVVVQGGLYLTLNNAFLTEGYHTAPSINEEFARARPYAFEETRLPVPAHPKYETWEATSFGLNYYRSHMILYGALGMDPCTPVIPRNKVEYHSSGIGVLARHLFGPDAEVGKFGDYYKRDPDALFFRLAGCDGRPKLRLIGAFEERALGPGPPITPDAMSSAVMVERPDTGERRLVKVTAGEFPGAASLSDQGMAVTHFSANRLEVTVEEVGPKGAWLVYADAFHPGWRAAVDGRPAPVWRANLAFKAIFLPPGTTAVGFDFTHPWRQAAHWFIALVSLAFMFFGFLPGAANAFMPRRPGAILRR
ncbi:MAG: hypothetical protein IIC56_01120 [Proteobacteria bacterium]|nr:hypothetical protein [Pseudomonadota bacterium]